MRHVLAVVARNTNGAMATSFDRQACGRVGVKLAILLIAACTPSAAALLHEALGPFERLEPRTYQPTDIDVFEEFGLDEAEEAEYRTADGRSVLVRALQFYADTGAVAAYAWLRPPGAKEVQRGERAVEMDNTILIHFANYVLWLEGDWPDEEDVELALAYLPRPKPTADPPVLQYVPEELLVADSGRHILGPVSLDRLAPELPPSTVGFHFGTEGYFARYATPGGEMRMIIWDYPSNPIARAQSEAFRAFAGGVAKHDGPLIAVVLDPASPDDAQRLLARVRYRAEVTAHVGETNRYDNLRNILLDTVILCGLLATLMVLGGILVAGTRRLAGRLAPESILAPPAGPGMQRLEIDSSTDSLERRSPSGSSNRLR